MSALIFAEMFRKQPLPHSGRTGDEDRYYQSFEPKNRPNTFSIATIAVLAGCVAIALNLLPG